MINDTPPAPRFQIGWYNGFSPEVRRAGSAQKDAVKSGEIARPEVCSICGTRGFYGSENPVWFHDEDYDNPLAAHHVCRRCHISLHRRFEDPEPWIQRVRDYGDGTRWFEQLTMDPASLHQPLGRTYPDGLPRDL